MRIIEATRNDIPELATVEIQSKLLSFPGKLEKYEVDFDSRVSRWQTYFDGLSPQTSRKERRTLKAINNDGKIAGYISAHLTTRFNIDAEIQSFYILYQEQRKGLGKKLFMQIIEWLKLWKVESLCVGINPDNAYKWFYIKNGGRFLNDHWIVWDNINQLN